MNKEDKEDIRIAIDFNVEEILNRIMIGCKYKNIEEFASKQEISIHRINLWIEEDDIEAIIDFCNEQEISKHVVCENKNVILVKDKTVTDTAMENLVRHFKLNNIRELKKVLDVKEATLFDWRRNNRIGELVEAVSKKRKGALTYIFNKEDESLK